MANYNLVIEKKSNEFLPIEWNKISEYKFLNDKVLRDIVIFTTSFQDESELKQYLNNNNLLEQENINKKLKIIYKSKGQYKKLQYGISFKEDAKYFDTSYMIRFLWNKVYDYKFLEKLCNHYRNSYIQQNNIYELRNYIIKLKRFEENNILLSELVKKGLYIEELNDVYNLFVDFVSRECHDYDSNKYTYKKNEDGSFKLKYKNLRDLAMFLSFNDREDIKQEIKEEPIQKIKIIKKSSKDIDGQLSFKDMGWI